MHARAVSWLQALLAQLRADAAVADGLADVGAAASSPMPAPWGGSAPDRSPPSATPAGAGASENKRARLREMEQAMQQKELELRQAARPATTVPVSTREYP